MAKYQLVTNCNWVGCECYHKIEGDFDSEQEALDAFGGDDVAWQQALEDHAPEYYVEKVED